MTKPTNEAYTGLRNLVFTLNRETLQLPEETEADEVLGVLVEEALPGGHTYSLVAWISGETSMYFSTGGGFIGAGHYPEPSKVAREWVIFAAGYKALLHEVTLTPLPLPGAINFYFITDNGILGTSAEISAISERTDPLTSVYMKAKNLVTAIRIQSHESEV